MKQVCYPSVNNIDLVRVVFDQYAKAFIILVIWTQQNAKKSSNHIFRGIQDNFSGMKYQYS